MDAEVEGRVLRVTHVELQTLSRTGRPCEACGRAMRDHDWVMLDTHGFADSCSRMPGGVNVSTS